MMVCELAVNDRVGLASLLQTAPVHAGRRRKRRDLKKWKELKMKMQLGVGST
jgi:hypothetical protein